MEYIAIILGLIGLAMAWRSVRKNADLKEKIAQANSRVYNLRREHADRLEQTGQELMGLKFEIMKLQGNLKITSDMKIGDVIAFHPQAQQLLAGFHIGGCSSCYVDERQTLGEAVAVNGRELEPILAALNALATESNGGEVVEPARLKRPNVELQIPS